VSSREQKPGVLNKKNGQVDNRVIPVMREAVALVQMVLFRELKDTLAAKYTDLAEEEFRRFIGCLVNDVFGTPAQDPESAAFARRHRDAVEEELRTLAVRVPDILPHLTDALRMQTICDKEEGLNTLPTLLRAKALGILQEDRPLPMPSNFMISVRGLGARYGLLESLVGASPASEQQG